MRKSAQSLNEYGIGLFLVAIVGLITLKLVGDNVADLFTNTISRKKPEIAAVANPVAPANGASTPVIIPQLFFANVPSRLVTVDLGNGKKLSFYYSEPADLAETAGTDGVTSQSAKLILELADQLKAQGEIDETTYQDMVELAKRGHKIKDLQALIAKKLPANGFKTAEERYNFLNDPKNSVLFDGKRITLMEATQSELSQEVAWEGYEANYSNKQDYIGAAEYMEFALSSSSGYQSGVDHNMKQFEALANDPTLTTLGLFQNQLARVLSSSSIKNPAVKDLIRNVLALDIVDSSKSTYYVPSKQELSSMLKQRTEASSNDICKLSNSTSCQERNG